MDQRHTNVPACCGHVASAIPIGRKDHIGLRFRFINRCIGSSIDENVRLDIGQRPSDTGSLRDVHIWPPPTHHGTTRMSQTGVQFVG
jgi:hypothetical protein